MCLPIIRLADLPDCPTLVNFDEVIRDLWAPGMNQSQRDDFAKWYGLSYVPYTGPTPLYGTFQSRVRAFGCGQGGVTAAC